MARIIFYEHWFNAGGRIAPSEGVRSRWRKYAGYLVPGQEVEGKARREELYDLLANPHETINLTEDPQYDQRLNRMRDL